MFLEKYYYLPNDKNKKFLIRSIKPKKTIYTQKKIPIILLIHGMNFFGINDHRLKHLAKVFSNLGFNVITPEIPEIKNMIISGETLKSIEDFFILFQETLFYDNVGLFLISFSGGMSLIPLSSKKTKGTFKSVLSIGSYSNFQNTIPYVLNNFDLDNYGSYILLYNYIDLITKNIKLKNYFYDNIIFNSLEKQNSAYLKLKNNFSKHEEIFCNRIEKDLKFRLEIGQIIIKKKIDQINKLSPLNYIKNLDPECNYYFLHGNNDKIICKDESIEIYQKIKDFKKTKLLITDLINHGNSNYSFSNYFKIPSLISFFNEFLNKITGEY